MIKLADFSHQELSRFLLSYQETSLSLKINISSHQDLPLVEVLQQELRKLNNLKELNLVVPKNTILSEQGYCQISNAVIHLNQLNKLSITIGESCFLSNEGLNILKDMISDLKQLVYLKLRIEKNNYITAESVQIFLDSLTAQQNLATLKLHLKHIQSSSSEINNEDTHFWREISSLSKLESLSLSFGNQYESYSDLLKLFANFSNFQKLKSLSLIIDNKGQGMRFLDDLIQYIGQIIELRVFKIKLIDEEIILNQDERRSILKSLSNLSLLEKLKLNKLGQYLLTNCFSEYIHLIGNLKYLKELSLEGCYRFDRSQMLLLSHSFLGFTHLTNFELTSLGNISISFLNNLSIAFQAMKNLQSLKLLFEEKVNEIESKILGESLLNLPHLIKLYLILTFQSQVKKVGLLQNMGSLINLKSLELVIYDSDLEQDILFDSVSKLYQLENLSLQLFYEFYLQNDLKNLEGLSSALMNLRKLKSLKFKISITDLNNQAYLDMLEKPFKYLQDLEVLQINLNILRKIPGLQNVSLIQHLTKLKKLDIIFNYVHLNLFGCIKPSDIQRKIDSCSLMCFGKVETQEFINVLESLSEFILVKLEIVIMLDDYTNYQDQLKRVCLKFHNIKKLIIRDISNFLLEFYANGIKEMKSLKTLELIGHSCLLREEDTSILYETLLNLVNLSKFNFNFSNQQQVNQNIIEMLLKNSLKSFQKLKRIDFSITVPTEEIDMFGYVDGRTKQIFIENALTLYDEEDNTPKKQLLDLRGDDDDQIKIYNASNIESQQLSSETQLLNNSADNNQQNNKLQPNYKYQPIQIKGTLDVLQLQDRYDLKYLNQLNLNTLFVTQIRMLEQFVSGQSLLKQDYFTSLKQLISLSLFLDCMTLTEGQLTFLSDLITNLINLQELKIEFESFQLCTQNFFDSFKHLVNLNELTIKSNITDLGATSLGNSLTTIKKLQKCDLCFKEQSTLTLIGFLLIFSGIKENMNLRELSLSLSTLQDNNFIIQENISNLKLLEKLYLNINLEERMELICSKEFLSSIGSLEYINILQINFSEANSLNQEMLNELIKSLTQQQFINRTDVSINLQSGVPIIISEEIATLFNKDPSYELFITANENSIWIVQNQCSITLSSATIENLQMDFIGYLNERIEVSFNIESSNILRNIKMCSAKQIKIIIDNYWSEQEDFDTAWEFISRQQNAFQLTISILFSYDIDVERQLIKLAQNLIKIKNLKVFQLILKSTIDKSLLVEILNIIKQLILLQVIQLNTTDQDINRQIIPLIKRAIVRLVKLNH